MKVHFVCCECAPGAAGRARVIDSIIKNQNLKLIIKKKIARILII